MPDDASPATVLVAAEEPMVLRILQHKLIREGHRVVTASSADSLRSSLHDGVDVAVVAAAWVGMVRDAPARCGWLVLLNAFDDPDAASNAMHAGAAGVVRMPFKPTVVASQVSTLLGLVRA